LHPEWVVIAGVDAVVAIAAIVVIIATVWTFGSRLFRYLLLIKEVIVIPPGGCPRARVADVEVMTLDVVLRRDSCL
jgi:hypothetical protein